MKIAIYPGSFDPIHNGHLNVIERASKLCDTVIVAIAHNPAKKQGLFECSERLELIREVTVHINGLEITSFDGLLADFFRQVNAEAVIRGLRAISDFEFEFQMALMNRSILDELETIFLVPNQKDIFLSSRIIKEVARLGGEIDDFVPEPVKQALQEKFKNSQGGD